MTAAVASDADRSDARSTAGRPDGAFVGGLPGIPTGDAADRRTPQRRPHAPPVHTRAAAQVEYRPLFVGSLLNENPNKSLPFYWTINPYRGCEFGCRFCYARFTHDFLELRDPEAFERRIFVKLQAAEALRSSLRPGVLRDRPVAIGTATDPYQPAEKRFGVTRSILEVLRECPDLELSLTTKSPMVLRDLDLLSEIARSRPLRIHITIATLNPDLSRLLEHRSPWPQRRLETIRRLTDAGVPTAVFVMPILPGITDHPEDLLRLLRAAREAGADQAFGNLLHLEDAARRAFWPVLERHFPHLVERYAVLYSGGRLGKSEERQRVQTLFCTLRREAGFAEQATERAYEPVVGEQLRLGV